MTPGDYVMVPVQEMQRLLEALKSHLDRDISVMEIISGSEPRWLCARDLEDLREQVRESGIALEANYDLHQENERLEREISVISGELHVSPDEQLETVIEWIRDGGN